MTTKSTGREFLVISRGQWNKESATEDIQAAIDEFYIWLQQCIDDGTMRTGSRLAIDGATVTKTGIFMDGPYGEAKEVIGGYWIIVAENLQEASELASRNPCLNHGIFFEIRLMDPECAVAGKRTVETPS